jgi:hypothetical protein
MMDPVSVLYVGSSTICRGGIPIPLLDDIPLKVALDQEVEHRERHLERHYQFSMLEAALYTAVAYPYPFRIISRSKWRLIKRLNTASGILKATERATLSTHDCGPSRSHSARLAACP